MSVIFIERPLQSYFTVLNMQPCIIFYSDKRSTVEWHEHISYGMNYRLEVLLGYEKTNRTSNVSMNM
jgi:hypothetical protein